MHRFVKEGLLVSVLQQPRCDVELVQDIERETIIEKEAAPAGMTWLVTEYGTAGLLGVLGAVFLADPEACANNSSSSSSTDSSSSKLTPGQCQGFGWGMVGAAAPVLALAIYETTKLKDSTSYETMQISRGRREVNCGAERGAPGVLVKLDLGGGQIIDGLTDESGNYLLKYSGGALASDVRLRAATLQIGDRTETLDATPMIPRATLSDWYAQRRPVIAVFDIQDQGVGLAAETVSRLSDYLAMKLTSTKAYQVVPRSQIKERLIEEKRESYKQCYDHTCQIEIGKELAARKSLSTAIFRLGNQCRVTANLFDLKTSIAENGADQAGGCGEDDVVGTLDRVVGELSIRQKTPSSIE